MKTISLVDVYPASIGTALFLYELMAEREPIANISHKEMPAFYQHRDFVDSHPYRVWYIVRADEDQVGAVYLTRNDEIGIFILKAHQGHGSGKQAIYLLMQMHPVKRFLANIAPGNSRSIAMFEKLGFSLIQLTFAKEAVAGPNTKEIKP